MPATRHTVKNFNDLVSCTVAIKEREEILWRPMKEGD